MVKLKNIVQGIALGYALANSDVQADDNSNYFSPSNHIRENISDSTNNNSILSDEERARNKRINNLYNGMGIASSIFFGSLLLFYLFNQRR